MPERLEIFTLGGLRVLVDGSPIRGLASRKAEGLLAYLALHGGAPSRESLATLLWDDRSLSGSLSNLSVLLSSLRKDLGRFLDIERETVGLAASASWHCDAQAFDRETVAFQAGAGNLSAADADRLEQALGLYRGPFLEGFFLREARGFEEWSAVQRERLQARAVAGHRALAEYGLTRREYRRGLDHAQASLRLDPLSESTHRSTMLLLARSGEMAHALAQYQTCRQVLETELGVEPSFETTDLYHRLRSAVEGRASNLPVPMTSLVGREAELAWVAENLADPRARLLTIVGPGGAGKTRLAIEAAARAADGFLHGVCFVAAGNLTLADQFSPAVAQALGFSFQPGAAMSSQLAAYLQQRELLLVLDGLEHAASSADLLAGWLEGAAGLRILATSREPLRMLGETVLEIGGLPYPAAEAHGGGEQAAVELFVRSAARARSGFVLSDEDRPSVLTICRRVDGLPLALEMAGAWTASYGVRQVAEELERSLDFLSGAYRDLPERQRSLRAVFDHSWRRLSPDEQDHFMRLSVFRAAFSREAALAVAEASPADLARLADKSLLHRASKERYETHEVLRFYAREIAGEDPVTSAGVTARFRSHYASLLERLGADLGGPHQAAALDGMGMQIDDIRWTWQSAVETADRETLRRCLQGLAKFYMIRGLFHEGAEAFAAAVGAVRGSSGEAGNAVLIGMLLARAGMFQVELFQLDEAGRLLQEALTFLEAAGDDEENAACLNRLGIVARKSGNYDEARRAHERALEAARRIDSRRGMADSLNGLGVAMYFLGRYDEADGHFQEARRLFEDLGDEQGAGRCVLNLANVADRRGDFPAARELYERSLSMSRNTGDRWGEAAALNNLGNVLLAQEAYREAAGFYSESLAIKRDLGHQEGVAASLDNLGRAAFGMGELGEARRLRQASLEIRRDIRDSWGIANCLVGLGDIDLATGNLAEAETDYREALQTAVEIQVPMLIEAALIGWAELMANRGETDRALGILNFIVRRGAKDRLTQAKAERLRDELAGVRPVPARTAVAAGEPMDLEALAASVLGERVPSRPPMPRTSS